MAKLEETRMRQGLKKHVAEANERTVGEAKILLKAFEEEYAIEMALLLLYKRVTLLSRSGATKYDVATVPTDEIDGVYNDSFFGEIDPFHLKHGSRSAKIFERVRRQGYRPKIVWVEDFQGEEGHIDKSHWAIRIDWGE